MKVENLYQYNEMIDWIDRAIRAISNRVTDRLDNKAYGVIVYRVKNIIRIDIKD